MDPNEWNRTLTYLRSELNRIQTMAGTLSTIEQEHFRRLSNFDQRDLMEIAVEEQQAARQLGAIKEMCLAMSQKLDELHAGRDKDTGDADGAPIH